MSDDYSFQPLKLSVRNRESVSKEFNKIVVFATGGIFLIIIFILYINFYDAMDEKDIILALSL